MPVDHTKNIISVRGVSFSYGKNAVLDNVSLSIHEGDYLGIIGPNGGGKSTLLKIIVGLLKPSTGAVELFGEKHSAFKNWSSIGYVAQKATHFDPLFPATVYEIAAMGRFGKKKLFESLNATDHTIIERSLHEVGMWEFRERLIGDLSGGQQQRVLIARALAGEPRVIFLDEPTVGVDVKTQEQFYALLKHLNQDLGLTLLLVSHDIDVIANEATELACINQSLVYHGAPKEFFANDYLHKLYGKSIHMILHDH